MKVVPVLDVMGGQVVRGIAGRRHEYRPIFSKRCASSEPSAIARSFREQFELNELYLADLDAIAGGPPRLDIYAALRADGFRLWVDAGIRGPENAKSIADSGVERLIVGLETIAGPEALAALCRAHGRRIVFSLDLKDGAPLTVAEQWKMSSPFEIVRQAVDLGVTSILVLDLRRVGTGKGTGTEELCRRMSAAYPHVELTAGGGVRGVADLRRLQDCGAHYALVASALHDGLITREELPTSSTAI